MLWERSEVPFNREILGRYTGLGDRQLGKYLDRLVADGTLGVDAEAGEMRWTVRGKARLAGGPETLERFERIQKLRAEARAKVSREAENRRRLRAGLEQLSDPADEPEDGDRDDEDDDEDDGGGRSMIRVGAGVAKGALGLIASAAAPLDSRRAKGDKSLALSAGLSLLGPIGWLYAGSFREAVPATLLYLGLAALLPSALLWPILWIALPASAIAGAAYAFQHNRKGQRTPLFLGPVKSKKKQKKKRKNKSHDD